MQIKFWKIYAKIMAVLLGMVAFAAGTNLAAHVIELVTGVGSGWVMLAFGAAYIVIGVGVAAHQVTKETD
ncbi:MAG: hypothetical protein O7G84_01055 [Gammaproteobacteria bacterium]|nr:hypothetical protein [Gammaproteobacteria bacterium]